MSMECLNPSIVNAGSGGRRFPSPMRCCIKRYWQLGPTVEIGKDNGMGLRFRENSRNVSFV